MEIEPCQLVAETNLSSAIGEMIDISLVDGNERGIFIFEKNGSLRFTDIQSGKPSSITMMMPSILGLGIIPRGQPVATFHTHPNKDFDTIFSVADFKQLIDGDLKFSGVAFRDNGIDKLRVLVPEGFESSDSLFDHIMENKIQGNKNPTVVDILRAANEQLTRCVIEV